LIIGFTLFIIAIFIIAISSRNIFAKYVLWK